MEKALAIVSELVKNFKSQEAAFLSPSYQESEVRQDFIDKFFTALGWDVTHTREINPYEREVKIENTVHMAGTQRRADYAFFAKPNFRDPKFFAEAKKPSRNLFNIDDYYQTIRYGWNANTPIAVLTDFEEFHIIDCRYKPDPETALSCKLHRFHYSEYDNPKVFSLIYWLFSREAVLDGSIEKRAEELPKPRQKAMEGLLFKGAYKSVDEAFLEDLDDYRKILAKIFKKTNVDLQSAELTEAVQRTIDQLVFIRFLEDKQIEQEGIVTLRTRKSPWKAFLALCKQLEPKYNGLLFKPHRILEGLNFAPPEEQHFVNICDDLSDPSSPYNFDQIPISILGSIYERFLGKVVHATNKRVTVDPKEDVKIAGGVFYTPQYVVRYIVSETIGQLINGKTPNQISQMAFADIACGSGSFLIEVYNELLDYHLRYYLENVEEAVDNIIFIDGKPTLTLKKKKEILLNNIYGIDIDFQATEVTQLSLYLKLLENATVNEAHQFVTVKEQILPNLMRNIVCGNSIVDRDYIDPNLVPRNEIFEVKPINIYDIFPLVKNRGGFDAIVGNPPYLKITKNNIRPSVMQYYKEHYQSLQGGSSKNLFQLFIEKVLSLHPKAFGFIVPEALLTTTSNSIIRKKMMNAMNLHSLIIFDHFVFHEANIGTTIFILNSVRTEKINVLKMNEQGELTFLKSLHPDECVTKWDAASKSSNSDLLNKISSSSPQLGGNVWISKGMVVQDRNNYLVEKPQRNYLPFILGNCLQRYSMEYKLFAKHADLTIVGGTKSLARHTTVPRILIRRTGNIICATYSDKPELTESTVYILTSPVFDLKYLLGILNSKLMTFFLQQKLLTNVQGYPQVLVGQLEELPIKKLDTNNPVHKQIVNCVDEMLETKRLLKDAFTDEQTNSLITLFETLDRRIDEAVYSLYGLTVDEIRIVEGK